MAENLSLEKMPQDCLFDIITAFEVIEHIVNPYEFMQNLHNRLSPHGKVAIATGDAEGFLPKLLGKRWWYLNPPGHCIIYSKQSLAHLLTMSGFKILHQRNVMYHNTGLRNVCLKLFRSFDFPSYSYNVIKYLPNIPVKVFHGSTQFLIAEKI